MSTLQEHPTFKQLQTRRMMLGLLSMLLSIATLYIVLGISVNPDLTLPEGSKLAWNFWDGEGWWEILIALAFIGYSTFKVTGLIVEDDSMICIHPPSDAAKELPYDTDRIRENTLRIAGEMGVTIEEVYIAEKSVPNAFATFALERGDIMVLHTNLIDIMDEEALNSIIAHELGHMAGNDVMYMVGSTLPKKLAQLLLLLIYIKLFGILLMSNGLREVFWRTLEILGVFIGAQIWLGLTNQVDMMYSRCKEKMADMYGAFYSSVEASINSFVRLNARSHALEAFVNALKDRKHIDGTILASAVDYFPYGNPTADFVKEVAPKCYAQAHLKQLCKTLAIELPSEIESQMIEQLMMHHTVPEGEAGSENAEEEKTKPFSWTVFDHNQDGILQTNEISDMLSAMEKNPSALTDDEGDSGTHPSNRTRIFFLAKAFGLISSN